MSLQVPGSNRAASGDSSLRTRRLSTSTPGSSASAAHGHGPGSAQSHGSSAVAASKVGARLLNRRDSVAYHAQGTNGRSNGSGSTGPYGAIAGQGQGYHPGGAGQQQQQRQRLAPPLTGSGGGPQSYQQQQQQQPHRSNTTGATSNSSRKDGGVAASEAEDQLARTGLDVEALAGETFKPEEFLKQSLDGPAEVESLRKLKARLEGAVKITEGELQKSVFKNYADFVVISKEIATLENEMLELKSVLEEWRAVPESLEGGWGDDDLFMSGAAGSNRRGQRNSLADLATLYRSQLAALWEGVEGAQKLLPYIPGRHIIAESASFVELNAATYKPKQHVHLFLLNDAMLVSVQKRRHTGVMGPSASASTSAPGAGGVAGVGSGTSGGVATGAATRLVAERCFNLSDIVVVDLKDGGDLTNALKIKRGKETIIFRTDKAEDKKVLLLAFKKVAEELMNKKRKEMLSEAEARKGDISTLRGMRQDYDGSLSSTGFSPAKILGFGHDDPTGKDLSWIGDFSDELAVAIVTRTFEDATTLVEKGKSLVPHLSGDPAALHLLRGKLDRGTNDLIAALLQDLSDQSIRKSGVVQLTAWLLRLGQAERARGTFLSGRGTLVRKRARQIKFEGDVGMYISELAMVTFTLIKNTCDWYMAAFKDNRMASGFVRWASEQVEIFATTFRRQVYGADQDGKTIQEALDVTKAHGAMLRDVGLDFTFLLDGLLKPEGSEPTVASHQGLDHLRAGGTKGSAVALARQSILVAGPR